MAKKPKNPTPGNPVRGSTTGKPIMALLDLLGQRWALRILWELRDNALTFRALQEACDGVSPSVLNSRLKALKEARFVDATPDGYVLTTLGKELQEEFGGLYQWSEKWAASLAKNTPD